MAVTKPDTMVHRKEAAWADREITEFRTQILALLLWPGVCSLLIHSTDSYWQALDLCTCKMGDQTRSLLRSLVCESVAPHGPINVLKLAIRWLLILLLPTLSDFPWLTWESPFSSITEHIDFATPIQQPAMEPLCNGNLPTSMHTLDHLHGVSNRASLHYTGESQLTEVSAQL